MLKHIEYRWFTMCDALVFWGFFTQLNFISLKNVDLDPNLFHHLKMNHDLKFENFFLRNMLAMPMNVFHDCVIDEPSKQLEYLLPNYCLSTFKTCTTRQMPRIKTADGYCTW